MKDIPFTLFEDSISMIERTALKLLPIMKELGSRLAGTKEKFIYEPLSNIDNEPQPSDNTPKQDDQEE